MMAFAPVLRDRSDLILHLRFPSLIFPRVDILWFFRTPEDSHQRCYRRHSREYEPEADEDRTGNAKVTGQVDLLAESCIAQIFRAVILRGDLFFATGAVEAKRSVMMAGDAVFRGRGVVICNSRADDEWRPVERVDDIFGRPVLGAI